MKDQSALITLPYRGVRNHIPMPRENRAAQFSPFAALTGYDEVITEECRVTEEKRYLEEGLTEELDRSVKECMGKDAEITYFEPDMKKSGGAYITVRGRIKRVIPETGILLLDDGTLIRLKAITEVRALQ